MALQLTVDSLDSVAEPLRSLYTETEGKFRLQVDGIEDTKGLKSTLEKFKADSKTTAAKLLEYETKYAGIDPDQVKNLMSKFNSQEEAALIAAGKMDEVIELRTERQRQDAAKQIKDAQGLVDQANARADKFSQRVLDNHIRAAAAKAGIHSHAVEDALFRGRNLFSLDEDGEAIQKGSDGRPVFGKDGKTLFSPYEWLDSMKENAPHWFPANGSGGNANGGNGKGQGANTITRAEYEARMSRGEPMGAFIRGGGKIID